MGGSGTGNGGGSGTGGNSGNQQAGGRGNTGNGEDGAQARSILDWEEADGYSFEDSDRFEEDSLCSWSSEAESLINNWRGWRRPPAGFGLSKKSSEGQYFFFFFFFSKKYICALGEVSYGFFNLFIINKRKQKKFILNI